VAPLRGRRGKAERPVAPLVDDLSRIDRAPTQPA
jgi:hypothetical protein